MADTKQIRVTYDYRCFFFFISFIDLRKDRYNKGNMRIKKEGRQKNPYGVMSKHGFFFLNEKVKELASFLWVTLISAPRAVPRTTPCREQGTKYNLGG